MRVLQAVLVFLLLGGAVAVPQSPAYATVGIPSPLDIVGYGSRKCIDDPNNSLVNNTVMDIYTCDGTATNEQWQYQDKGGGWFWIVNVKSGRCLTVKNASGLPNYPILQFTCNTNDNEEWTFGGTTWLQPGLNGEVYAYRLLENKLSLLCLTVKNNGTTNNSTLLQYDCNSGNNQKWARPLNVAA